MTQEEIDPLRMAIGVNAVGANLKTLGDVAESATRSLKEFAVASDDWAVIIERLRRASVREP